jgi:hypothetical protein
MQKRGFAALARGNEVAKISKIQVSKKGGLTKGGMMKAEESQGELKNQYGSREP